MTMYTHQDDDHNPEKSRIPVVLCQSAPALVPNANVANDQALIEPLEHSLETASTFAEVKDVLNHAGPLRDLLRSVNAGLQAQNKAAETKIRPSGNWARSWRS